LNAHSDSTDASEELGTLGTIFLHDVTKIDCAMFDPSKGIYGQTYKVDVTLGGPVGANGFIYDFALLKKMVRQTLKASLDHALIIPINSQSVQFRGVESGECWKMRSKGGKAGGDEWEYLSPAGAVFPSRCVALSRQTLEQEFARSLRHRLPQTITSVGVALREEELDPTEATFRYTHGIAGHEGLCQRLLHGHRSRLQVYVGEERRVDLEHYIARDVLGSNVHMATPSQFVRGMIEPGTRGKTKEPVTLGYDAGQGRFEATLPADRVFCVAGETSIECITQELARLVKREENTSERVKVICYEGVDKGAFAEL
jgi:6-pyruvoyl-tetrahydropterin synthase